MPMIRISVLACFVSFVSVHLVPTDAWLLRRALTKTSQPVGVDDVNQKIAVARDEMDSWNLECIQRRDETGRLHEGAQARLASADAEVGEAQRALTQVQGGQQELALTLQNLKDRRVASIKACGRSESGRVAQHDLVADTRNLAGKVMKVIEATPGSVGAHMARLKGSLKDQTAWLGRGARKRRKACDLRMNDIDLQLKDAMSAQNATSEKMRGALAMLNRTSERQLNVTADFERLTALQEKDASECARATGQLSNRTKELRNTRNKMLLEAGESPAVSDCEVTPWLATEMCSVSCGGGTKNLSRTILRNAGGGAPCPKLTRTVLCNQAPCQVDCEMGGWSGWSNCSAPCGGGQHTRERAVLRAVHAGGQPCKVKHEQKACNVRPCSDGCKLGDWGSWGLCTKACGGGQRGRRRARIGMCPAAEDVEEFEQCNGLNCPAKLQCTTRMEFVVLVDASELLDRTSFGHQIQFAANLLGRLYLSKVNGSLAGAVVYGAGVKDQEAFSPLTEDVAHLQEWLGAQQIGKGALKLEEGLTAAGRLLRSGNADLPSTVLILLDGRPDSIRLARHQSKVLQEHGVRVAIAAVGRLANNYMLGDIVSTPVVDNLFIAPSFEALQQTLETTFVGLCPAGKAATAAAAESPASSWYLPPPR